MSGELSAGGGLNSNAVNRQIGLIDHPKTSVIFSWINNNYALRGVRMDTGIGEEMAVDCL
jgi:hypothetical protein